MITLIILFLVFIVSPILVALKIIKAKEKKKIFMACGMIIEIRPYELKLERENGDIILVSFDSFHENWFEKFNFKLNERVAIPCSTLNLHI